LGTDFQKFSFLNFLQLHVPTSRIHGYKHLRLC
jgi:UDP-galactopyranose mutase